VTAVLVGITGLTLHEQGNSSWLQNTLSLSAGVAYLGLRSQRVRHGRLASVFVVVNLGGQQAGCGPLHSEASQRCTGHGRARLAGLGYVGAAQSRPSVPMVAGRWR
jgi:hypothetical protein